jgi:predicted metal-dependent phosphoesterase TrpH
MKIDMHIHTIYSDGLNSPEKIVRYAKRVGLDGIAITDHNNIGGWERAINEGKRLGIDVIKGEEVKVRDNGRIVGELLVYFIEEKINPASSAEEVFDIIDKVREQDAIISVSHPFSSRMNRDFFKNFLKNNSPIMGFVERLKIKLDAIEVINGRTEKFLNEKSRIYANEKKLVGTSGSDAHMLTELGNFYTYSEASDLEEFRSLIRKNRRDKIFPLGEDRSIFWIYSRRIATQLAKLRF